MSDRAKIEWANASWNPIRARDLGPVGGVGWHCEIVSPGCENCYAQALNKRLGTDRPYLRRERDAVAVFLDDKILAQPLHWHRPRKIFVCSTSDLFGEWVPDEMIDRIVAVMALCPQHSFILLTKRAARMREYVSHLNRAERIAERVLVEGRNLPFGHLGFRTESFHHGPMGAVGCRWPLPQIWLGVSAEDQRRLDERVPNLLATPAAKRFVSYEPALGPVDLPEKLDWVICGGESGAGARPMHPGWARSLRDQCQAASVPFFFKQWGEWLDADQKLADLRRAGIRITGPDSGNLWEPRSPLNFADARTLAEVTGHKFLHQSDGSTLIRVGKRAAGRLLDGREWNEFPDA